MFLNFGKARWLECEVADNTASLVRKNADHQMTSSGLSFY